MQEGSGGGTQSREGIWGPLLQLLPTLQLFATCVLILMTSLKGGRGQPLFIIKVFLFITCLLISLESSAPCSLENLNWLKRICPSSVEPMISWQVFIIREEQRGGEKEAGIWNGGMCVCVLCVSLCVSFLFLSPWVTFANLYGATKLKLSVASAVMYYI